jgi:hypothetical protein
MPDLYTGEFANLGVVLYCPELKFLECRVTSKYARLSDFFGDVQGTHLMATLRYFEKRISKVAEEIFGLFDAEFKNLGYDKIETITASILPNDDSALQLSEVVTGLDISPQNTIDYLFDRIIERYNNDSQLQHTDQYVWRNVYKVHFDKYGITKKLTKHLVTTDKDEIKFERAWKNGIWHCYQALSFDLKSEDSIKGKAYKWSGIIRALETAVEPINLYLLTTTPKDENAVLRDFISTTLAFEGSDLSVHIINENEADNFASQTRKQMEESKLFGDDELLFKK